MREYLRISSIVTPSSALTMFASKSGFGNIGATVHTINLEESLKNIDLTLLKPSYHSLVSKKIACTSSFKHQLKVSLFRSFFMSQTTSSMSFRGPGYQRRRRRGEEKSDFILCVKVHVFFLLLPSFIS